MDKITVSNIQTLSRVIKTVNYKLKKSPLWLLLNSEYGIGHMDGSHILLDRNDHDKIRELVLSQTNIDLLAPLPTGDRISVSLITGDEKFSAEAPGRHHIALTSHTGQLELNGHTITLLPGASYRVDWRSLDITAKAIIVVENLKAFDEFYKANLPPQITNAWVVYRGHNISSKAVKDFLSAIPKGTPITAFSDYDPAGLIISKTTIGVTHYLLPPLDIAFKRATGTHDRFMSQHASVTHLENNPLPETLTAHYDRLMKKRLCVSQEQMLSLQMPLLLIETPF